MVVYPTGLNIIQDDLSSPTTADSTMSQELLEAQLEMWTNLEFPTAYSGPTFNPERDNASRSRHKAIDPKSPAAPTVSDPLANSLSYFGNVGVALSSSSQEKSKSSSQLQSLNDLFQWGPVYNNTADGLFNSSDIAVDPMLLPHSEAVNYAIGLGSDDHQPLTIRDLKESRPRSLTLHTIDPATTSLSHAPTPTLTSAPAAKRQRLRKPSSSVDLHSNYDFTSHDLDNEDRQRHHAHSRSFSVVSGTSAHEQADGQSHTKGEPGVPYSAAEDKRRRNTLASARFRLKKKEREVAMEKKAKELDDKVMELERECESLRKENQWLKGLVVGATNGDSNHGSTLTSPANGLISTTQTPANGMHGTAMTNVDAAKGNIIDIDELIRVLRANGAVVTGTAATAAAQAAQASALAPATGKRKRGAAATN
jgi:hypothetical protein